MASRATNDLTERFRAKFSVFCMYLIEAGVPFVIAQTQRSIEESQDNIDKGTSWVENARSSRHVDAYLRGWDMHGADAADIVPYDTYLLHGPDKLQWDTSDPVWLKVRDAAYRAGLKWGVIKMVKGVATQVDPGHVYWDGSIYGPNYKPTAPAGTSGTLSA